MPTRAPTIPSSNSPRVLGTRGRTDSASTKHRRHDILTAHAFARDKMHEHIPLLSPLFERDDKTPPTRIIRRRIQTR